MSKRLQVNLIKYGICVVIAALMVWAYIAAREFEPVSWKERYLILCDAFTIPGILFISAGALVWVSNLGAMDGIVYCLRFMVFSLIPGKRLERDEQYGEYVERKSQNRVKGYGFLFWSGLITMGIALIFMALYYSLS